MLDELARHARIIKGTRSIVSTDRSVTHFLQGGLFEERKAIRALFPVELAKYRPRLGAIVYDLIPWVFPTAYLSDARLARDYMRVLSALSRLDRLFTISESVRRDVIAIANTEPSRVETIYGGLDEMRWGAIRKLGPSPDAVRGLRISNDEGESFAVETPFWLYVGGDDFRKNLPRLFEALSLLKRAGQLHIPLVVACSMTMARRRELLAQASAMGLRPGVDLILTGFVSDETLGRLFANCMATIFPSLYEGLGLPVLESYVFGKPVLASDTSSFRELVPQRCRFDPYSAASIADAIRRFGEDPQVAEESLAFAPEALAIGRWANAVGKIGDWLDGLSAHTEALGDNEPLWVATSLPPDESGVAFYTQRSLAAPAKPVAFFAPDRGALAMETARHALALARHGLQLEAAPAEILSIATLPDARISAARPVVFVLGNSEHHLETLAHLLTYGIRSGDAVHLHDVFIRGLLALHFGTESRLREVLGDAYGTDVVAKRLRNGASVHEDGGHLLGPRLLVQRVGVRHFIVNSVLAADRLRKDLEDDVAHVQIDVLFLPVLPVRFRAPQRDPELLRVGHFGILRRGKHLEQLIAACDLLAGRRRIELVVAGYGVHRYLRDHGSKRDYMRVTDSPSSDRLEELMSGVDCAVQLRYPDHGESSGVVNQLLALRRPVTCTRTGSFEEMEGIVELVAPDVSPAGLASAIERTAEAGWPEGADAFVAKRSPRAFEARLREILGHRGTTSAPGQSN
jgi:glycosyltransferase involved in cell wall biosynthesis